MQSETQKKPVPSWIFQGAQASRLWCLVVTGEPESHLAGTEMAPRQTPVPPALCADSLTKS
jgi:hypothetical protein